MLPLIVNSVLDNHPVLGILIDDRSPYNLIIYLRIFKRLGMRKKNLKSCEGRNLLEVNNSSTYRCGTRDLLVSFGEGKNKRSVKVYFLIIPFENIYNDIQGRSFLAVLDAVASTVHLKMIYHNSLGDSIVIVAGLHGYLLIEETILKNPLANVVLGM